VARPRKSARGRALGFATRQIGTAPTAPEDGSWTFVVNAIDAKTSRLIARGRGAPTEGTSALIASLTFEAAHFVMERRMLLGIAALAEGRPISALHDAAQVLTWTLAFLAFVVSGALVLLGRQAKRRWFTFLAAGLLFEALTLLQPSPWLGIVLVVTLVSAMFAPLSSWVARVARVARRLELWRRDPVRAA
jgi:hypothetical protein